MHGFIVIVVCSAVVLLAINAHILKHVVKRIVWEIYKQPRKYLCPNISWATDLCSDWQLLLERSYIPLPHDSYIVGGRLTGKAYVGGTCGNSSVVIVTDNGGFGGVKAISHELAHL